MLSTAVALGGPMGAYVSSYLHRQVLATMVYVTDTVQFVAACIIVEISTVLAILTPCACFSGPYFILFLFTFWNTSTHTSCLQ